MQDVWWLGSISLVAYVFMYFDMFYIQWHHLAKKDLWNKAYILFYSTQVFEEEFNGVRKCFEMQ
jgi:hypothetical protein